MLQARRQLRAQARLLGLDRFGNAAQRIQVRRRIAVAPGVVGDDIEALAQQSVQKGEVGVHGLRRTG